jgi:protein-L-isoaspartate O-methyltransferase
LVIPLGDRDEQMLNVITRRGDVLTQVEAGPVRFVPLLGKESWES